MMIKMIRATLLIIMMVGMNDNSDGRAIMNDDDRDRTRRNKERKGKGLESI